MLNFIKEAIRKKKEQKELERKAYEEVEKEAKAEAIKELKPELVKMYKEQELEKFRKKKRGVLKSLGDEFKLSTKKVDNEKLKRMLH